ncbi:MAG: ABC transporter ATP-binding protein [Gammaproteobacteria bacterium]|nr:ABC transporter ATP-binding protein [Gammaproteobacteria bacterium]
MAGNTTEDSIIEVCAASKHYGLVRAVDGVDLKVPRGGILGLIGRNGAGKSTLFKAMLGLTPITSGEIRIGGQPVRGRTFREVRRSIGYLPENAVFYDNLTGLETLQFFAALKRVDRRECPRLLERVGLGTALAQRVKGYSKGMRQRLALAQALLGQPRLLFLDEPTNGLDPDGVREFYAILRELRGQGGTVLLTSHILAEIQEQVDQLAIMKLGRIQALGTLQELRKAMDLPFTVLVTPHEGALERLRQAVARLGLDAVPAGGALLAIKCRHDRKMLVLKTLARLDGAVADLQVREPSLEDVFLGYAG